MSIQNINGQPAFYTSKMNKKADASAPEKTKTDAAVQEQAAETTQRKDHFEHAETIKPVTYSKPKLSETQVKQLEDAQRQRVESFQKMLQSMVVKQGQKSNLTLFGMDLYVTKADSMKAAASLQDGGEYSVDAVATRIMDMAKALSGGDPSKIEELRTAVQKGFQAAGVELGGKLPGICQDTYTEVMDRFDKWKSESSAE